MLNSQITCKLQPTLYKRPCMANRQLAWGPASSGHRSCIKRTNTPLIAKAGAGGALQKPSEDNAEPKYAPLHDFCMSIPYSLVLLVVGVVGVITKQLWWQAVLTTGVAVACFTVLSLRSYKARIEGVNYTKLQGVASAFLLSSLFRLSQHHKLGLFSAAIATVTTAFLGFIAFNVVSGGNAPKSYTPEELAAMEEQAALAEGAEAPKSEDEKSGEKGG